MSKGEADTKEVGSLRAKLGGLDVPGRGLNPKTLKKKKEVETEIKSVWLELKQVRDCSG